MSIELEPGGNAVPALVTGPGQLGNWNCPETVSQPLARLRAIKAHCSSSSLPPYHQPFFLPLFPKLGYKLLKPKTYVEMFSNLHSLQIG